MFNLSRVFYTKRTVENREFFLKIIRTNLNWGVFSLPFIKVHKTSEYKYVLETRIKIIWFSQNALL